MGLKRYQYVRDKNRRIQIFIVALVDGSCGNCVNQNVDSEKIIYVESICMQISIKKNKNVKHKKHENFK